MSSKEISILIVFILYMISMIVVGAIFTGKKMSLSDYILGGRKLNPWVSAMSTQASDMSGWLLTGIPGMAFATVNGAKEAIWTALGLMIGTFLNWLFVAKRLRVYSQVAGNSLTIPSYLGNRFKDRRGILSAVAAVVIFVFFTVYTASMFSAGAKLFSNIFPLDYRTALVIGAVVIIVYTFLGGFLAVSWTDLFQGLLMFFALMIIPIVMMTNMGEEGMITANGVFKNIADLFYEEAAAGSASGVTFGFLGIISSLAWGLGYFGMPHILVRFMATKDKKTIRSATVIAMIWVLISMGCALAIGILATGLGINVDDPEQILIAVIGKLFHPILAGIFLSAVLAAIMSTADSQLLVAASAFSNDIYRKFIRKNASDKEALWVSRGAIVVIAIIALIIAYDENSSIFKLVQYAWAGFGASFGPVILFSLYSKRITMKGAVASIVTGALTTIIFKYGLSRLGGFWAIYELLPGFILATAALWIVSLLDKKKPSQEISDDFDKMLERVKSKDGDLTLKEDIEEKAAETTVADVVSEN